MNDPRRNRPSASAMELYSRCHGAFMLSQQVNESEIVKIDGGEEGTRIHAANEASDITMLDDVNEQDMLKRIREKEAEIYEKWTKDKGIDDALEIHREQRLWIDTDAASAQLDFYVVSPSKRAALVIDAKSGRRGATPAPRNLQLRTQLVALNQQYPLRECRVAIVQPMVKEQPTCDYNRELIGIAQSEIRTLANVIDDPYAKRTPGDWCERCPARHICPEAQKITKAITALRGLRWETVAPEKKKELWDACKVAESIIKQIKENIKSDLAHDPTSIPGLEKRPSFEVREVTDAIGVYGSLVNEGDPAEFNRVFNSAVRLSVERIEEWVRTHYGLETHEEAKAWVERYLGQFITKVPREGRILSAPK